MQKTITKPFRAPYAYFITFTTYGNWLHFDNRLSVDRNHNQYGHPKLKPNKTAHAKKYNALMHEPFILNTAQRKNVMQTAIEVCRYSNWRLFAIHVRTNHVHLIVQADQAPEYVMGKIKAYASRNLNLLNPENKNRPYWTRHGSTIPIRAKDYLFFVMDYVVNQQGSKVACFYEKWLDTFRETRIIPDN